MKKTVFSFWFKKDVSVLKVVSGMADLSKLVNLLFVIVSN